MRKYLVVILLFSSLKLFSQGKFTVNGKIEGLDSKIMYLRYENADGHKIEDSVKVTSGSFSYTGSITNMALVYINPNMDRVSKSYTPSLADLKELGLSEKDAPNVIVQIPSDAAKFQFIASPGAQISFTGKITDYVDAYPKGNLTNIQLANVNRHRYPLTNEVANIEFKLGVKASKDSAEIKTQTIKLNK